MICLVTGMDGLTVDTKRKFVAEFKMKYLGMMHYFLGMEVWQKRFGMMDYKAMTTPMASNLNLLSVASSEMVDAMMYHQMICSLMYLINTRPDICFAMNTLRHVPLMVTKHAVRCLKGIVDYGIKYDVN